MNIRNLTLLLLLLSVFSVQARVEVHEFQNIESEQRYNKLINELRCLVCQNQNLADSNAEVAQDLRKKTYELVESGKTEEEIVDFMVARYGDFVLYRPPFKMSTMFLWVGPFIIFILAVYLMLRTIRKRRKQVDDTMVTEDDIHQAELLLAEKNNGKNL